MMIQSELIRNNKKIYGNDIFETELDNVIIPQETLPTLKAELKNIGLEAKARHGQEAHSDHILKRIQEKPSELLEYLIDEDTGL